MASSANTLDTKNSSSRLAPGVMPLRAGQGNSFLLRRLHSLTGIVPIGAFLLEHFISNSEAAKGALAYNDQVKFLTGLPFVQVLEWVFIFIPILYHALYGFYIWYRGESNVGEYPWTGNWLYTSQRWTGLIAFLYILYHTYYMRFTGVHADDGSVYVSAVVDAVAPRGRIWPTGVALGVGRDGAVTSRIPLPTLPVAGLTLSDHRLWVGLRNATLIRTPVAPAGLAAGSPWPKERGDLRNSGTSAP